MYLEITSSVNDALEQSLHNVRLRLRSRRGPTRPGSTANTRVIIDVGFLVREIFAVTACNAGGQRGKSCAGFLPDVIELHGREVFVNISQPKTTFSSLSYLIILFIFQPAGSRESLTRL